MRLNRILTRGAAALALLATSAVPVTAGAADPHDEADAMFDALNGPMAGFVVRPTDFGIDPTRVLADVPAMLDRIDPARARATVEGLSFSRSADDTQEQLDVAIDHVTGLFEDAGLTPEFQDVTFRGRSMPNISAEIPGTGCADRTLVIGAHYDARPSGGQGADDNASGVGGLMEIARAIDADPLPITVRIVAFSFEEVGLVGSQVMAEGDAAAGADIVGAVSLDMIGYSTPEIDPLTGLPGTYLAMIADPTSEVLARSYGAGAYWYNPTFPAAGAVIDPNVLADIFRSDHYAYVLNGYTGMMATDTANFRNPHYHTVGDTIDTIDWEYLTGATTSLLAGTATFASSDQNGDGVADLCQAPADDPDDEPTEPASSDGSAPPATAVRTDPAYTG